jgi:hypothetical protein
MVRGYHAVQRPPCRVWFGHVVVKVFDEHRVEIVRSCYIEHMAGSTEHQGIGAVPIRLPHHCLPANLSPRNRFRSPRSQILDSPGYLLLPGRLNVLVPD